MTSANPNGDIQLIRPRISGEIRELAAEQSSRSVQFGTLALRRPKTCGLDCAIGYRRWLEFDPVNGLGQDAANLRTDGEYAVGIVADGVSQSFFGDIAALRVTDLLAKVLWEKRERPMLSRELETLLTDCQKTVDREYVQSRRLPDHFFEIQREALEVTRQSGSQTVFAAFVLDVPARKLVLYQVGDVDAVVQTRDRESRVYRSDPSGRWSSAGKSDMLLERKDLMDVESVLLRSDGAGQWGSKTEDVYDADRFATLARQKAEKDDLSFIAVRLWDREADSRIPADTSQPLAGVRPPEDLPPKTALSLPMMKPGIGVETRRTSVSYPVRSQETAPSSPRPGGRGSQQPRRTPETVRESPEPIEREEGPPMVTGSFAIFGMIVTFILGVLVGVLLTWNQRSAQVDQGDSGPRRGNQAVEESQPQTDQDNGGLVLDPRYSDNATTRPRKKR